MNFSRKIFSNSKIKSDQKLLEQISHHISSTNTKLEHFESEMNFVRQQCNWKKQKERVILDREISISENSVEGLQNEVADMINFTRNTDTRLSEILITNTDKLKQFEDSIFSEQYENLQHTMQVHQFDYQPTVQYGTNPINYPIHNFNLGEKFEKFPHHNYVSGLQTRLKHKNDVKNAKKRDGLASKLPGAIKNIDAVKLREKQLDNLPEEFGKLKYLLDDENLKKMEYFRKIDQKFVAKVEAPWENPS